MPVSEGNATPAVLPTTETPTPPTPEPEPMESPKPTELLYHTWVTDSRVTHIIRTTLDPQGYDLSVYFEIPYFYPEFGDHGDTQKLNQFFQTLSDEFFSPANSNLLDIWESAQENRAGLVYQSNAEVTFRSKAAVSVVMRSYWCGGGVSCYGQKNYTFRTDTAELLTLSDVAEGSEEELKTAILVSIEAAAEERFYDTEKVLAAAEEYTLEDFKFCVYPDGIEINFDSYELGRTGAQGPFSVRPDVKVKDEWLD